MLEGVPGFIGWADNINTVTSKEKYLDYAASFSLEALQLQPVGNNNYSKCFLERKCPLVTIFSISNILHLVGLDKLHPLQ